MTKKEARRPLQSFLAKIWRSSLIQLGERFLHCLEIRQIPRRSRLLGVLHGAVLVYHESRARAHAAQTDEVRKQHTVILGRLLI